MFCSQKLVILYFFKLNDNRVKFYLRFMTMFYRFDECFTDFTFQVVLIKFNNVDTSLKNKNELMGYDYFNNNCSETISTYFIKKYCRLNDGKISGTISHNLLLQYS